jgi:hypothetical protein
MLPRVALVILGLLVIAIAGICVWLYEGGPFAVSGYLIIAAFWLISPLALTGYFLTRRGLNRSRRLILFDIVVVAVGVLVVACWFGLIAGDQVSYEERLIGYYMYPLMIAFVFVPLLLIAGVLRYCIFSKPSEESTHAR